MSRLKLPIIIAVVMAALGGGLFFSGLVGGSDAPAKKHVVEPITLAEPFVVNLADTDENALLAINVALKLEPMDDEHWATFSGGDGGHGATEAPGPIKVATYPKFYDAVITVTSNFTSDKLRTEDGKNKLKAALLERFHEIAVIDTNELKQSAAAGDPGHLGPPYHVSDVDFTKYAIQTS